MLLFQQAVATLSAFGFEHEVFLDWFKGKTCLWLAICPPQTLIALKIFATFLGLKGQRVDMNNGW